MGPSIVEIQDVSKVYRRGQFDVTALEKIALKVDEGEFVALMGPSGSGKTTLLNLIAGFDVPSAGQIVVDGVEIGKMKENQLAQWRTRGVGFVFQTYNLIPVLTAFENVELPLLLLNMSKKERREHVLAALKVVGLEDRADHYPRQLSGGQEQRVGIARAIVTDPKIILADEVTGNLDSDSAEEILSLLSQLSERFKKTLILVTHDPKAAQRAHRIEHLEKGRLVDSADRRTKEAM